MGHHHRFSPREQSRKHSRSYGSSSRKTEEEKKAIKSQESGLEKEERRLLKRQRKKLKLEKQNRDFCNYTNESNPFGDNQLTKPFIWKKKFEKAGIKHTADIVRYAKEKLKAESESRHEEIVRVKKSREERLAHMAEMEQLKVLLDREQAIAENEDWEEKEEEFHIQQARLRSHLRIKDKREKPFDVLAKNLHLSEGIRDDDLQISFDVDLIGPIEMLSDLQFDALQELEQEIRDQVNLGGSGVDYWNALAVLCKDEVAKKDSRPQLLAAPSIHPAVRSDIEALLNGKTHQELAELRTQVQDQVDGKVDGSLGIMDPEYWSSMLHCVDVAMAKAHLSQFHEQLLAKQLTQLKQSRNKQLDETQQDKPADKYAVSMLKNTITYTESEEDFAPALLPFGYDGIDPDSIIDQMEDLKQQEQERTEIQQLINNRVPSNIGAIEPDRCHILEAAGVNRFIVAPDTSNARIFNESIDTSVQADEEEFNVEISLPSSQHYEKFDKFRPRKPRFLNRVKTGFEWNKYNATHYDRDNPPPKIVQGYRFNLFYPDLIDPTVPPTFYVDPIENEPDYCTIRFHAGPPYEDVAFKIVNKEWESSYRRGYRCLFDHGVFTLCFNFRRFRYRR